MLARIFDTVRYLKPCQVYNRVSRQIPYRLRSSITAPQTRGRAGAWTKAIQRQDSQITPGEFRFLNQERRIKSWNDPDIPKLWLYNLHYFDSPSSDLIRNWIAENPIGKGNGWEPYPLSLRICNWIKWVLCGNKLDDSAHESLATQAQYLAQSIEFHLLGNHLFANAKALVFAGAYFQGGLAEAWMETGLSILADQLPEQVLEDGGHFERSPMYHCLILEDVLDLINLRRARPGLLPDVSTYASRMLGWLQNMTHPDGGIAFFNDAVFGVAPEPAELIAYAARLGVLPDKRQLGDSGYIRLENARAVVLFDAALIGPDYQPGHAHADTLSFELSLDGRRSIVNSGISTYEDNILRHDQRGTAAHNAVRIDNKDSSQVWSSFRVARRARPIEVSTNGHSLARASHTGYLRLKDPVFHTRSLELQRDSLIVSDRIEARGKHKIEIFFHSHPQTDVQVELDDKVARHEEVGSWFPEFNRAIPGRIVIGRWSGQCPSNFVSRIPFP
jgi:uncharacterized heparinase superfamily protein